MTGSWWTMLRCKDHNHTMCKVPPDYDWFCTHPKHIRPIFADRTRAVIGGGQWWNKLKDRGDICSCGRCEKHIGEGLYASE